MLIIKKENLRRFRLTRSSLVPILLTIAFTIFIFLQINSIDKESLTWDEIQHFKVGYAALLNNDFSVDPLSGTLISQLAALPSLFSFNRLQHSRLVISFLSVITSFTIFFFTKRWFGSITALVASIFFLFEPTIFAHSHYVTLDIGFTLLFFITYWLLIVFQQKPTLNNIFFLGISTGFLFATKITGLAFFGITFIIFCLLFKKIISFKYITVFLVTAFFAIWFVYRFQFATLGGFSEGGLRKSNEIVKKLEIINPKLSQFVKNAMIVPLPLGDYIRILKNSFVYNLNPKYSFFIGEMRDNPGRLYIPLLLFKLPLSLLIFFSIGLLAYRKKLTLILVPIISILIYMFFSNVNLRLRYILPIYPFIVIISAIGFTNVYKKFLVFRIPLLLLYILFFTISIKSMPHTISYANEISGLFGKPYMVFSDSNIDWGQGLITLKDYVQKNNIGRVDLSYYGTDDPRDYGFIGFARENISKNSCTIETTIPNSKYKDKSIVALSITNWQECGWYKSDKYNVSKIKDVVGGSILIF